MKTPIEMMMDGIQWVAVDPLADLPGDGIPHATHEGEMEILGVKLKCYRLSTGQAIIDAESVQALFGSME